MNTHAVCVQASPTFPARKLDPTATLTYGPIRQDRFRPELRLHSELLGSRKASP